MAKKDDNFWLNKKGESVHEGNIPITEKIKDELVENLITIAKDTSDTILSFKAEALSQIEEYYQLLLQEYKVDAKGESKKGNLAIENYSGTAKVTITVSDRIAFDEKLSIAKVKIDEFLHEATKNASPDIQTLITKAFDVDKKGDINAKKILALKSYDIAHPKWLEAMAIIDDATEIVSSKNYIRFYARENIEDEYKLIPLDIAGV
ncbi:DUF3164 family protein [Sulfurimonas sp.]|uniref:DUF3164 family protein n=1 Tax=Sulfurimonas sp. TaxID=2022749 RepID=UPI0025E54E40|nr:DUF3164 family protein [Sulfurimonas sp.]